MNEALVVCIRGIISFFTLHIFIRILGKQQIGQITFFDYIVGITIGSFAASLTVDLSSAAWPHFVGLLIWLILGVLVQKVSLKSLKISEYIHDKPVIIIHDGKIIAENLRKTKFTFSGIISQLRLRDIFDISDVKYGIIEPNGGLSILNNAEYRSLLTRLGRQGDIRDEIIFNGMIIEDNVEKRSLKCEWIINRLKEEGINSVSEVFLAYIDSSGQLRIYDYREKIICSNDIFK